MKTKHTHISRSARKRAISLIEGVLYLVIALAVIIGGIVFFNQANLSRQVKETSSMMTTVSAYLIDKLKESSETAANPLFESASTPTAFAIKSGAVPSSMIDPDLQVIRDPWGGVVTFYEAAAEIGTSRVPVLAARLNDIPAGACMRLGHKNAGGDTPVGMNVIAMTVEDNFAIAATDAWVGGEEVYRIEGQNETNFGELASACQEGHDLIVYYAVNGTPDVIPAINGTSTPASGGGVRGGGSPVPTVTDPNTGPPPGGLCRSRFEELVPCSELYPPVTTEPEVETGGFGRATNRG